MSFTFENLKTAFMSDIELWSSRHRRHRYRRYRRHRRSPRNVDGKIKSDEEAKKKEKKLSWRDKEFL
ncbi:hypothetical protein [Absidia glauca]|uniref:Uncharacterized protein n=1 Tax=Absidia glauca TaxID=4829 RepID=A0A163M731_ABSGL|nr:hypothetical protein [Absidia glauca]